MEIRQYQAGDEEAQVRIYNAVAGRFPNFKPASAAEVARRHQGSPALASSSFYAVVEGEVVGYAVFDQNGRISYPWCLPGHEESQRPLLDAVVRGMKDLGLKRAWAAYRADWTEILDEFRAQGFMPSREMINYVADLSSIPRTALAEGYSIAPLRREDQNELFTWLGATDSPEDREFLGRFFWENPHFAPESLFVARRDRDGQVVGVALVIHKEGFADPTKLDSSMPCFRLGAFGGERERHKRVDGMFSCLATSGEVREILLAEATRRLEQAGLNQIATQVPSDQPELVAFYDRIFRRQGAFPIVSRTLA